MLKHIWVHPLMDHLSIGLLFQHLYLLLVSALTSSQMQNRQVRNIFSFTSYKHRTIRKQWYQVADMKYYFHLSTYWNKGPSSTISMVYTSEGSTSNTIEVGQGSLKLIFTADEGKLTHFVNSRNLVCYIL